MVVEKVVVKSAAALDGAGKDAKEIVGGAGSKGAPPAPLKFHFVKNFGVADVLKFTDGTKFSFRRIQRNKGGGYAPNSFLKTDDEKLAANLREAAKNPARGIVEIK